MTFKRKEKGKKLKLYLLLCLCFVIFFPCSWFFIIKFESEHPVISIYHPPDFIGETVEISGLISDGKSGLRNVWIGLLKDRKESVLLNKNFNAKGLINTTQVNQHNFNIIISCKKLGISDGKVKLRIAALDQSWKNWFKGNKAYIEKEIIVDTKPPEISVLSNQHYLSQGGSGLVIYRVTESSQSGVHVGDEFFPGYTGYFDDSNIYLAFFAIGYSQDSNTNLYVEAKDLAGNISKAGFYYHIRNKNFKTDTINLSENFLNRKLPEFYNYDGIGATSSIVDKFLFVNRDVREQNNQSILKTSEKTEASLFWDKPFSRLPNSARKAGFADHRIYKYEGKVIDKAVHLGLDLASIQHAEVPAANSGRVAYAGRIGIYGNVVCIDHGFSLFSVYAHLSRIDVEIGDLVSINDTIGHTGSTGLAGGDHLHFGMFIHHIFVNPVEWWDGDWITNNITSKINNIKSRLN